MAEYVRFRQERMLPEYELMEQEQIFDDDEMRQLKRMRENFDYKICKQRKCIKDFLEYISFEQKILRLVVEREKSRNQKYTELEHSVAQHIKSLYKEATRLFPEELKLWESYVKFCKHCKFYPEVTFAFERMLQFHGDKPEVWLRAGMWEYHEIQDMEKVKDLFMRGLQRHPDNTKLYSTFFKIMIAEAAKMNTECNLEENTESEQSLGLKRVEIIYKNSKSIKSVEYFEELLKACEGYAFTKDLQRVIVQDLLQTFPRNEEAWDVLAQRELRGYSMCDFAEGDELKSFTGEDENDDGSSTRHGFIERPLKRRIELCFSIYEKAVESCKTEKMWSLYINALLDLNKDMSTHQELKRQKLGAALKAAHELCCLSEDHYFLYINLLADTEADEALLLDVMRKSVELYPTSAKLWQEYVYHHIKNEDEPKVFAVFREATARLPADSAHDLWALVLRYYQSREGSDARVDEIFREACKQTSNGLAAFRAQYLQWTRTKKDMQETRRLYEELVHIPPPCLELHQKMAELEAEEPSPDSSKWRKCHEYATHFFGKSRTDVWIDFMKFERDHGDPTRTTLLYERAKESLDDELVSQFIQEHNLVRLGQ